VKAALNRRTPNFSCGAFDGSDFFFGEAVEFVNEGVDLLVGGGEI